jgi:hypothetical protein
VAAFTSKASGNWNSSGATTWNQAGVPGAGDAVTIQAGHTVTVPDGYAASCLSLTFTGAASNLTVGGGTSGSLTLKGNVTESTVDARTVTLAAGSTLTFDTSGAGSGSRYLWTTNSQTKFFFNGSSGHRVTVTSTTGGGSLPGGFTTGANFYGGYITATFTDFSFLGDAATDAWFQTLNHNYVTSADWKFSFADCTFDHCGQFKTVGDTGTTGAAVTQLVRCVSTNTLDTVGSNRFGFYFSPDTPTSGAYAITNCRFDRPVLLLTTAGLAATGNVFWGGFYCTSTTPWASFDNNTVRLFSAVDQQNGICGPFTNNFVYYDDPTRVNGHLAPVTNATTNTTLAITGNVLFCNSTDNAMRGFLVSDFASACQVSIKNNLVLPGGGSNGSCDFLSVLSNNSNARLTVEHNTCCVENHWGLPLESITAADTTNRFLSVRGNLFWGTSGAIGSSAARNLVAFATDAGTRGIDNVIPPAVLGYNGKFGVNGTSNTAVHNQAAGYAVPFASAFAPTGDVIPGSLAFKTASANAASFNALAAWDLSLGGAGTEASAKAGLLAGTAGYTTAAFVAFARDAYRPTTTALHAASYPGDASTADAAGTAWATTPDLGAMAYFAAASPGRPPALGPAPTLAGSAVSLGACSRLG